MPYSMLSSYQMRNIKEIKQTIKELFEVRKRIRFPYKELAKMFCVDLKTLYRWENEENIPNDVYLPMIRKFIEISKKNKS